MADIVSYVLSLCFLFSCVTSTPFATSPNSARPQNLRRDVPQIPERPTGVGLNSYHGVQFNYMDEIGFVPGSPGVEAAPVFLYSRTDSSDVSQRSSFPSSVVRPHA